MSAATATDDWVLLLFDSRNRLRCLRAGRRAGSSAKCSATHRNGWTAGARLPLAGDAALAVFVAVRRAC